MKTDKLIEEALSLPVEERALIADSPLRSLNEPKSAVDDKWIEAAQRRLGEIRESKVKPVPGEEVFAAISKRFAE